MSNYILSINPRLKNTGFTLWKKTNDLEDNCDCECHIDNSANHYIGDCCGNTTTIIDNYEWKPIWVSNYRFDRYDEDEFNKKIMNEICWLISTLDGYDFNDLTLYIERGFQGFRGSETLDHLRGNIFGLFNKYLSKDKLISPKEWQNWCLEIDRIYSELKINKRKVSKGNWLYIANVLIKWKHWNIDIKDDNDIADSLLIGWYVINVKLAE